MHYIRFLKTPKIHVDGGRTILKASVTATTDLGETFFDEDVDLAATLRSSDLDGDVYLRRTLHWSSGMRALPITLDLTHTEVDWPAKLHVGLRNRHGQLLDHFEIFYAPADPTALVSVWSEPLDATKGQLQTSTRVERKFMPETERPLVIYEDTGDSIARHIWDGSVALAAYIDRVVAMQAPTSLPLLERALISATFRKLNVVELGCGCGIVGISLAQTVPDCDVLLTDLPEVDELVARNIEVSNPAICSNLDFAALDWENPLPTAIQSRTFDIVIAAECVYNSDSIPSLVKTLSALVTRSPNAIIVIATKFRHESERIFFDLCTKAGIVENGRVALPLPGKPGHGYGDFSTEVGLHIMHGRNYRASRSPDERDHVFELSSSSE